MNEWFRKILEQIKTLWGKWTILQKVILASVAAAAVVATVLIVTLSSTPSMVSLIGTPIKDEDVLNRIVSVLDREGVSYRLSADKMIMMQDEKTARRLRGILIREDLIPPRTDPWAIFDVERWTLTDFERDVNLQRAITKNLEQHILALDDIDAASLTLVVPKAELFAEDQKPVSASVIITPKPGSDFVENRKKIEGIVKLIKFAVAGLKDENIVITDQNGIQLNDFEETEDPPTGLRNSRLALKARAGSAEAQAERQAATISKLRAELAAANERLAQQAAHFMDEMRRLGSGTSPASGQTRRTGRDTQRRRLAERVAQVDGAPASPDAIYDSNAKPSTQALPPIAKVEAGVATPGGAPELKAEPQAEPKTAAKNEPRTSEPPKEPKGEPMVVAATASPAAAPIAAEMPQTAAIPEERRKVRLLDRITGLGKA